MKREQIEEAADKHSGQWIDSSDEYSRIHNRDDYEYGFIAGVCWLADRLCLIPLNETLGELHEYWTEKQKQQQPKNV